MVQVIMHGCNGKMGQVITGLVKNDGTIDTNTYATTSQLPDLSSGNYLIEVEQTYNNNVLTKDYIFYTA